MMPHSFARLACAAFFAWLVLTPQAQAQQQPSATAVATAREILQLKGGLNAFDAVVPGVIQYHAELIITANPTAATDIEKVAVALRQELAPRVQEVHTELARGYASQFTEQELKDALAFYKTPLGKKLIDGEPKALDAATKRIDEWAAKLATEVGTKLRAEMKKRGHNLL